MNAITACFPILALLAGCATAASPKTGEVDYSCKVDADCAIKNVGNCCGQMPACVNANSPTFPKQVREDCDREGKMSICGHPVIDACRCDAGRCQPVQRDSTLPVR